jgi:hypothetical protein
LGRERPGSGGRVLSPTVTAVIATRNRCAELCTTLERLSNLPERPAIVVVDNGSSDGSAAYVRWRHPGVQLIAARRNLGAVGRNLALRQVTTPYVAFCDDDTWWEPGSLAVAADVLDAHPDVAAVTARIVVEPSGEDDPIVSELANSPVAAPPGLPGPALLSILAGASVLRTDAFRKVRGFSPPAVAGRGGGTALHRPGDRRLLAVLSPRGDRAPSGPAGPRRLPAPSARHQEHALVHLAAPPGLAGSAADRRTGRHRAP